LENGGWCTWLDKKYSLLKMILALPREEQLDRSSSHAAKKSLKS